MIEIRQLLNNKKDEALLFAKKVYIECKDESLEILKMFIDEKKFLLLF